jgi:hypothetical protein
MATIVDLMVANIRLLLTQWPKEKLQKDKQQSTKHTHIKLKIE